MNYVGKLLSNFRGFYNEINSATLTGAIDVVIVQQEDGSYISSPWHVRFGKMGVLRAREKVVYLDINGEAVDLHMKLGEGGAAFFVQEAEDAAEVPAYLATSPIPSSLELMESGLKELKKQSKAQPEPPPVGEEAPTPTIEDPTQTPTSDHPESVIIPIEPSPSVSETHSAFISTTSTETSYGFSDQVTTTAAEHTSFLTVDLGLKRIKSATDMGTQTDMTAKEVENKVSKVKIDDTTDPTINTSQDIQSQTIDSSNVDSVDSPLSARGVSDKSSSAPVKTKRRKKRSKILSHRRSDPMNVNTAKTESSESSVVDCSTVSVQIDDEGMFELELSSDEERDTDPQRGVARTVSMPVIESLSHRTDKWSGNQFASTFHPFSDGDITPIVSPVGSRPPTPKSDTEYETMKYDAQAQTQLTGDTLQCADDVKWRWGELPESQISPLHTSSPEKEDKPSSGLFNFMRKTKKMRHQPEQEGIYLDDLNLDQMDPEVAALYLYRGKGLELSPQPCHDDDNESGQGPSLPHSPLTVEKDNPLVTLSHKNMGVPDVALSLCGGLKEDAVEGHMPAEFVNCLVTYEKLCANPNLLTDPNLVVKIGDSYYNWQTAGPIVMSALAFQKPLPEAVVESLLKQHLPKKEKKRGWSMWWGGRAATDHPPESSPPLKKEETSQTSPVSSPPSSAPPSPAKSIHKAKSDVESKDETTDDDSDTSDRSASSAKEPPRDKPEKFKKSLKLTSEQVNKLKLKEGVNEATFSVTTRYQGTTRCTCFIYMWRWDDRIVVSDIDGTITKSDVLGHVLPMIGKDWSQAGIANLYNMISRNGYKFIYLSARAIGQSKITRDYLRNIRQGDLRLPDGPLLLSPSSLISAFHKEVIERKPEEFKISCLRDIAALFPNGKPFYCGFGNKVNDVYAYLAVDIPISRVFTVNHRGELRMELSSTFQSSYSRLSDVVDHFFPPLLDRPNLLLNGDTPAKLTLRKVPSGNFPEAQEYSTFTYWRNPLPDIETDLEVMKDHVQTSKKNTETTVSGEETK